MTLTTERAYTWLEPEQLNVDTRRYLADLLVGHLRDDHWTMRIDKTMVPIEAPGEMPGFSSVGVGRSDPLGSSHVLSFTAPPMYEMAIRKHLVVLDAGDYDRWCRYEASTYLPHLDRLLHNAREPRIFVAELSGYGSAKKLKMRRAQSITKDDAEAILSLLETCSICTLGT